MARGPVRCLWRPLLLRPLSFDENLIFLLIMPSVTAEEENWKLVLTRASRSGKAIYFLAASNGFVFRLSVRSESWIHFAKSFLWKFFISFNTHTHTHTRTHVRRNELFRRISYVFTGNNTEYSIRVIFHLKIFASARITSFLPLTINLNDKLYTYSICVLSV